MNQDGGSTVGPGFVATGTSYLAGDEQGVAIVCRSDNAISSASSLVIKELPVQKLTLNVPDGSLSESVQSVVLRINSFDASRAATLRQTAVAQINGITYATQALSPVTPASGAVIATGCQLQRVYEEVAGAISFDQEIWTAMTDREKAALIVELAVNLAWQPDLKASSARSFAGLLVSKEIALMNQASYDTYIKDMSSN
jgi:hypothetical protein